MKSQRGKSVHGRISWAQNSGNPFTKLKFCSYLHQRSFIVLSTNMKNDDFRGPFGVTLVVTMAIFIKFQGWAWGMMDHWSGRFGMAPVMALVIFKVALWRQ